MFKLQNTSTGKIVKNMITGKTFLFATEADAANTAASMHRDAVLNASAWNSKRGAKYAVIKA